MLGLARTTKLTAATAAAAIVLGVAPGGAGAALSCERSGGLLEVAISASGDSVGVLTDGERIVASDGFDEIACAGGTPTVLNTDTISIHNAPELTDNLVGIIGADTFTPGLTLEAGDDEIETFVNLNDGAGTLLAVSTSLNPGRLVFGTGGMLPPHGALDELARGERERHPGRDRQVVALVGADLRDEAVALGRAG